MPGAKVYQSTQQEVKAKNLLIHFLYSSELKLFLLSSSSKINIQ
jgi:hypothetical protein